jgi:PIN domain nuclease of toxin-antitoxin system
VIVLDTHVLLWLDTGSEALGRAAHAAIRTAWQEGRVSVSAISFWECAMLERRSRLRFQRSVAAWRLELLSSGLLEHAIDGDTAIVAAALDTPQKDPADRLIAATAIARDATLLTADEGLLGWRSMLRRQDARR